MYSDHPFFKPPTNQNATIWRYVNFAKLVSMLDRQALFFARADMLPDQFEGSYPAPSVEARPSMFGYVSPEARDEAVRQWSSIYRNMKTATFLNCWHLAENESAAMWQPHLKGDNGLAVQSTFRRLVQSLAPCEEYQVFIGQVEYIDYDKHQVPEGNTFFPFLYKRNCFEHERELRAVIQQLPVNEKGAVDWSKPLAATGIYVRVSVQDLMQAVYVSPGASAWFSELVSSVVEKYGFQTEVRRSRLEGDPLY